MRVTIAICTWNRADLLEQTLRGLARLVPPDDAAWDVLVVNNGSTDRTAALLSSIDVPYDFRWIDEPTQGKSYALNRVLAQATADYLLFTDDDVLVDEGWLRTFVDATRRYPAASGFGGRVVPWFPTPPEPELAAAFPALARGFCGLDRGDAERVLDPGQDAVGANMGIKRSAVEHLRFRVDLGVNGGETVGGEENEFQEQIRRGGGHLVWVPSMSVRHYVEPARMTIDYLKKFAEDAGRREVRVLGAPREAGIGGVPFWIIRQAAGAQARLLGCQLAGRRTEMLKWLRVRQEILGMAKESRRQYRTRASGVN